MNEIDQHHRTRILIDRKECLQCKHFVGKMGTNQPTECHHIKGNKNCPARDVVIVKGVDIDGFVGEYKAAFEAGDVLSMSGLVASLSNLDESVSKSILTKIHRV